MVRFKIRHIAVNLQGRKHIPVILKNADFYITHFINFTLLIIPRGHLRAICSFPIFQGEEILAESVSLMTFQRLSRILRQNGNWAQIISVSHCYPLHLLLPTIQRGFKEGDNN